ncbi:hypothetical protein QUB80_07355 [Chlorogloeopsis sp. ULAP01]|uniref:hypothetical protein n=1 Tax=Chlorogloeopsis sp. ULAP01 TaxID=3056483 RepID=UPI0025AAC635|nr:hypothetical protein [Chlorogloeopsis sp. ULAP01]MDM9380520.1 hypothetical protein [Chlorogloeopsis sp. ULAP01]
MKKLSFFLPRHLLQRSGAGVAPPPGNLQGRSGSSVYCLLPSTQHGFLSMNASSTLHS